MLSAAVTKDGHVMTSSEQVAGAIGDALHAVYICSILLMSFHAVLA